MKGFVLVAALSLGCAHVPMDAIGHAGIGFSLSAASYWFTAQTGAPKSTRAWWGALAPSLFCIGWEIGGIRAGSPESQSPPDVAACGAGYIIAEVASVIIDQVADPLPERIQCHAYELTEFGTVCAEE